MASRDHFQLDRTIRLETHADTRRRQRRWRGLLTAAVAALSVVGAVRVYRTIDAQSTSVAQPAHFETTPPPTVSSVSFDRADSAIQRRIQNATVLIAIMGPDWQLHSAATGTLLTDQRIDGHKAIATILHVGGTRSLDNRTGLRLVIIDHDGDILGVARPLTTALPTADSENGVDQPELLGFDPHYRLNTRKLASIQGVQLASELPVGMLSGKVEAVAGPASGASGGGWYDARGRLIGVGDVAVVDPGDLAFLRGQNLVFAAMKDVALDDPAATTKRLVPSFDRVGVKGLGAPPTMAQIRATTVAGAAMPTALAGPAKYDAAGFGYPLGMAMRWHARIATDPSLEHGYDDSVAAMKKTFRDEAAPASTGVPDTPKAHAYLAMVNGAEPRFRRALTSPIIADDNAGFDMPAAPPSPGDHP